MVLEQVTEAHTLCLWYQRDEIKFNLVRIGVRCETQSLRESHNMGIDADRRLAEGIAEKDIRRFSTDAGQRQKIR